MITPEDVAIKVENLSKVFKLYISPVDRLKESLHPLRKQYHRDFYALNGVSFEIKKGESVGIIGKNGSGKSTLLKIITGVLTPTSGVVQVRGKVSALLELGAGFNPELSGIENVYFNGMLMGYTREDMDDKLDDILSFADIGEFVYQPVKTYSSGMFVRLAFAVAVNVEPEILIVDEALSVGDSAFQMKCARKLEQFRDMGATFLFVTHDLAAMKSLCTKSLYMKKGFLQVAGTTLDVADEYLNDLLIETHSGQQELKLSTNSSKEISSAGIILEKSYLVCEGIDVTEIVSECNVTLNFEIRTFMEIDDPIVGFHLRNKHGITLFETNTYCMRQKLDKLVPGNLYKISFDIKMNVFPGDYSISFGCANKGYGRNMHEETILFRHDVILMKVVENPTSIIYDGYSNLMPTCSVNRL